MAVIRWTSKRLVPYTDKLLICPRYEIGDFFATFYFLLRSETAKAQELTKQLQTCLSSKKRPMKVSKQHPTSPESISAGSQKLGLHAEMHEGEHGQVVVYDGKPTNLALHNHWHVELVGAERDTPFTEEELGIIKHLLKQFSWG
jgi:hypothetical protein